MIVKYNEEPYDVILIMMRVDPNDTSRFLPEANFFLNVEYISKMIIGNDLIDPVPFINIDYIDRANLGVERFPPDGRSILFITMINQHMQNDKLYHFFVIDDIKVIEKGVDQNLLKISGRSSMHSILQSCTEFSSGEDSPDKHVEATKIVKDILETVKFPIDRDGIETDMRIHYVTPANHTVQRSVNDLIEYSLSESKGMFFLIYDMIKNTGRVLSMTELFETFDPMDVPNEDVPNYNILSIPGREGILSQYTIANDMVSTNNVLGSSTYNIVSESVRNNFSYLDRQWTQDPFSYERYMKILPGLPKSIFDEHQFIPQKVPRLLGDNLKYFEELPNMEYDRVYNKHFIMMTQMENIQFTTVNHMLRDVGQLILMYTNNSVDAQRFGGFWMISRIHHIFTSGKAMSNITAIRSMKIEGPLVSDQPDMGA